MKFDILSNPMPRRTFLRGLGTVMSLPLLEAMMPSKGYSLARPRPNRMAFVFVPNGIHMEDWTPTSPGANFELPFILDPLKNVREYVSVITGLAHDKARPNGDGPGDHARSTSAFLTGCQPRKTAGADIKVGVSVDQMAAQKIGHLTRFPSLEIGIERGAQAGNCDSGYSCAYSSAISWRSESTPVAKEVSPKLVFDRLFGAGDVGDPDESTEQRARYRKSVLDSVIDDAARLKLKLGVHDQNKMEEYFSSVREIERRVSNPNYSGVNQASNFKAEGTPTDLAEHMKLMSDLMILAFQTDQTRICSYMFANDGSNRNYRMIGIPEGHHDLSHHGMNKDKQAKIRQINRFHIQQLAYMVEKMKGIKEGDATLLDNTMIVYGAGISDGDRHNHDNLPVLMIGRGGGKINSGRHIKCAKETPMANMFVSMLDHMNVPTEHLGDSTGKLEYLTF